ncbi:hypothetical protein [Pararhizobium sp. IMCC21322]|uniref:hypothetical protein n=1 Tax=Pararhizobium sp. IMCC21322 TaxID=3067903 RepID=UPI0027406BE9|nr:hypothetical protein [Pararhizobium sp. IMCC21322]
MKTHELAKSLTALSKILRSVPNQELSDFGNLVSATKDAPSAERGISLSTLAVFSTYGKSEWQTVIADFDLPIEIRPRDAARDVMGKILTYLAENSQERDRIARKSLNTPKTTSELSNALSFLLKND